MLPEGIDRFARLPRVVLWRVDLDGPWSDGTDDDVLSDDERARFELVLDASRRRRVKRSRLALRAILGQSLDVRPDTVSLRSLDSGKPVMSGERSVPFSVTHCGSMGVVAVAESGAVGVDLELPRPAHDPLALARRFLSPAEAATVEHLDRALAWDAFLRCWTVKEAFAKAFNVPIGEMLRSLMVAPDPRRQLSVRERGSAPESGGLGGTGRQVYELCVARTRARLALVTADPV